MFFVSDLSKDSINVGLVRFTTMASFRTVEHVWSWSDGLSCGLCVTYGPESDSSGHLQPKITIGRFVTKTLTFDQSTSIRFRETLPSERDRVPRSV